MTIFFICGAMLFVDVFATSIQSQFEDSLKIGAKLGEGIEEDAWFRHQPRHCRQQSKTGDKTKNHCTIDYKATSHLIENKSF